MDRRTRCVEGFGVVWERDWGSMQQVVEDAPPAHRYFSGGFPAYAQLVYPGTHGRAGQGRDVQRGGRQRRVAPLPGAAGPPEPARLARRSRRFSRCLWALTRAVALFVYAWNRRQRFRRAFPKLPAEVCGFVADLI